MLYRINYTGWTWTADVPHSDKNYFFINTKMNVWWLSSEYNKDDRWWHKFILEDGRVAYLNNIHSINGLVAGHLLTEVNAT